MSEEEARRLRRVETLARRFLILWHADGSGCDQMTCEAAAKLSEYFGLDIDRIIDTANARYDRRRA
jgi:hypothetical protein